MLTRIKLQNLRCFASLRCDLAPGVTAFIGENAQGKTSILEAVCLGMRLQSPRTQNLGEVIRMGESHFAISSTCRGQELVFGYEKGRRRLTVNGEVMAQGTGYLKQSGLVVWMGNEDVNLIRGGGDGRRRFLDFLGSQFNPEYRPSLRSYERALRARNFLLKRDALPHWKEIDAYTEVLDRHSKVLTACRRSMIAELDPLANQLQQDVSGKDEPLALTYEPAQGDALAEALRERRGEEMKRRSTAAGPHRDDLTLTLQGLPAAQFASEGQRRTIALALKLAQAQLLHRVRGEQPLLLLDDIFGELDPARRNALMAVLPEGAQKLVTTTTLGWLEGQMRPDHLFRVSRGELTVGQFEA